MLGNQKNHYIKNLKAEKGVFSKLSRNNIID